MNLTLFKVLSLRGTVTLNEYYKIFNYFYSEGNDNVDRKILQHRLLYYLEALGHCEFDNDGRKIYVCKPTLATLPGTGSVRLALCGARDDEILGRLTKFSKLHSTDIDIDFIMQKREGLILPEVIKIKSYNYSVINDLRELIGADMQREVPTSWLIINTSNDIKHYESYLKKTPLVNLNWPVRFFNTDKMYFQRNKAGLQQVDLKEYTNPITNKRKYYLDIANQSMQVELDWGKYYLFNKLKKNILFYDEKKQVLGIPCNATLPKLLSRAITLCSGTSPIKATIENYNKFMNGVLVYAYSGVDRQIVEVLGKKVGQNIIEYSFKNDDIGGINDDRSN
jgi:hypothetical protein